MPRDRTLPEDWFDLMIEHAEPNCCVGAILRAIADHGRGKPISVDVALADLIRVSVYLLGSQNEGWRDGAVETVQRLIADGANDPDNQVQFQ